MGQKTLGCCLVLSVFSIVLLVFVVIMLVANPMMLGVKDSFANTALLSAIINLIFYFLILAMCLHYLLTGYFVFTLLKKYIVRRYQQWRYDVPPPSDAGNEEWYSVLPQNATDTNLDADSLLTRFRYAPSPAVPTDMATRKKSLFKTKSRRRESGLELTSVKNELQPLVSGRNMGGLDSFYS